MASIKARFCLLDVEKIKPTLAGAAPRTYTQCHQGNATALGIGPQGISYGWVDVYGKYVSGQSIDITGLPPGRYVLEVTVDPFYRLQEAEEVNNVAGVVVRVP